MRYVYGMRLRGFSLGCQPKQGFVGRRDDPSGRYHDIIVYNRQLEPQDEFSYDLDYLYKEDDK